MNNRSDRRNQIIDEAADWFVLMQQDSPAEADVREFADWLASSAEHVREYLHVSVLSGNFRDLPESKETAAMIEAGIRAKDDNVITMSNGRRGKLSPTNVSGRFRVTRRSPVMLVAQCALAIAFLAAVLVMPWLGEPRADYETGTGEQVSFPLEDGTVMTLNTKSRVRLAFNEEHRDVLLLDGEALFDVVKDERRPFRVLTGKAVISAVGTSFNVHHRRDSTVVTVVEGKIEVATRQPSSPKPTARGPGDPYTPVLLTIGQQARVEGNGGQVAVLETDVSNVTAWRQRRLIFDSKPLAAVVEEFNLYNDTPIRIGDRQLGMIEIGGSFSANERHSFAMFLKEAGLADVRIENDDTIVLLAPASSQP